MLAEFFALGLDGGTFTPNTMINTGNAVIFSCDNIIKVYTDHVKTIEGHQDLITSIDHSGQTLISSSLDCTLKLWDMELGTCKYTICDDQPIMKCLMYSGKIISSSSTCIKIWNEEKQLIHTIKNASKHFCIDKQVGIVIYADNESNIIKAFDLRGVINPDRQPKTIKTLQTASSKVAELKYRSDDGLIVVRHSDGGIEFFKLNLDSIETTDTTITTTTQHQWLLQHDQSPLVGNLTLLHDDLLVMSRVTSTNTFSLEFYSLVSGQLIQSLSHNEPILQHSLVYDKHSKSILYSSDHYLNMVNIGFTEDGRLKLYLESLLDIATSLKIKTVWRSVFASNNMVLSIVNVDGEKCVGQDWFQCNDIDKNMFLMKLPL